MALTLMVGLTACAGPIDDGETVTFPAGDGKSDSIGGRAIVWRSASGQDQLLTPTSVGYESSDLGTARSISYDHEGITTIESVDDRQVRVVSDRIVLPVRGDHFGDTWITANGIIDRLTNDVGYIVQYRLPGSTEWKTIKPTDIRGNAGPLVYARSHDEFAGTAHNSLGPQPGGGSTDSLRTDAEGKIVRESYWTYVLNDTLNITGFDLGFIPVPFGTWGSLPGSYDFAFASHVLCNEAECHGFDVGVVPPVPDEGSGRACMVHSDCAADERCECFRWQNQDQCKCWQGTRGAAPPGQSCQWGVDCATNLCAYVGATQRTCTASCTTNADCRNDYGFTECQDMPFYGRVCAPPDSSIVIN